MSTQYITKPPIPFARLRNNLPAGLREQSCKPGYVVPCCCITNGVSFIWAFQDDNGNACFERFGFNRPTQMLRLIEAAFNVEVRGQGTDLPLDEAIDG